MAYAKYPPVNNKIVSPVLTRGYVGASPMAYPLLVATTVAKMQHNDVNPYAIRGYVLDVVVTFWTLVLVPRTLD